MGMGSTKLVVERETIEVTDKESFEIITNKKQGSFSLSSEDAMRSSETDHKSSSPLLGGDEESLAQQPLATTLKNKQLELLPLIFLIYFEVSGGAYGEEASVGAAGPLLAILGFTIFPFIWSMPEALVTAELATTFPGNGGYVIWAERAFGPFWGSMMGSWKFLSGVINLASYPVLCIDYLKAVWPAMASGIPRYVAISTATVVLSFVNYTGISIVGYAAVVMGLASLSPFVVLTLWSIPKINPSRWSSLGQKGVTKNWSAFFNILFWNLNFWDNASTLAGEVENPQITYPKALFSAGILTCLAYLVPLLAVTGAIPLTNQQEWIDGYFAEAAQTIAGKWLKIWMEIGASLSSIGLFQAQLSSCAYQFLGMADLGMLPRGFGSRARHFNTPWVGILVSASIALAISYLDFSDIVASVNFLYSLGMLLEFASFIWLRRKLPKINRPYRVPMGIPGLVAMCLIPSVFLIYVMTVGSRTMYVVSGSLTALGVGWYFLMRICGSNNWVELNNDTITTTVNREEGLVTLGL